MYRDKEKNGGDASSVATHYGEVLIRGEDIIDESKGTADLANFSAHHHHQRC